MKYIKYFFFALIFSCTSTKKVEILSKNTTNIDFENTVKETDSLNILKNQYLYNGGGVAIGDFNQDNLQDIFFTGNMVSNRLYLNKGNMVFKDISKQSKIQDTSSWSSGVTLVDINNDNLLDIYVSNTFIENTESRKNKLYINKGFGKDSIPVFENQAAQFGLENTRHSVQSVFFDYDNDGDLDMFSITNISKSRNEQYVMKTKDYGDKSTADALYENTGNGNFLDVSEKAGITLEGFGLGVFIEDFNRDGWDDIYVSNDFISNDILYINNQDGTFSNQIEHYVKHQSLASMGIDTGDLNNDGFFDFMALDMRPYSHQRINSSFGRSDFNHYKLMESMDYQPQYAKNVLQMGNDNNTFSDISFFSGVASTDWSWSVLFFDWDNDGMKDISITNGFPKDVTDHDFIDFISGYNSILSTEADLIKKLSETKIPDFIYKNKGNFAFENMNDTWVDLPPSFSSGAAFGDLDNDGDLDYVVSNINMPTFVFKNNFREISKNNFLKVHLKGSSKNVQGIGARIRVVADTLEQSMRYFPTRGYLSHSSDIHFGLRKISKIDTLEVIWKDGRKSIMLNLDANQTVIIDYEKSKKVRPNKQHRKKTMLSEADSIMKPQFSHKKNSFSDFDVQPLALKMYSKQGPAISVGDINGDELDDIFLGGAESQNSFIYTQDLEGWKLQDTIFKSPRCNDASSVLFDIDADGDLDLYVSSSSAVNQKACSDRLYINEKGNLKQIVNKEYPSSLKSLPCDYDNDGDIDMFLCGGTNIEVYPNSRKSYLLENEGGILLPNFKSGLEDIFSSLGIINDGIWTDFNNDGWKDLILIGDWMPITFLKNNHGIFENVSDKLIPKKTSGWWSCIIQGDFDDDGDIDYIIGNQGINNNYNPEENKPLRLYIGDFDKNGNMDPIITYTQGNKEYPVHLKQDMHQQLQATRKKFVKYADYGKAQIQDILPQEILQETKVKEVYMFLSVHLENEDGQYVIHKLPYQAQLAPVKSALWGDIDNNGKNELVLVGNDYNFNAFDGQKDALNGLVLTMKNSKWDVLPIKTGFIVPHNGNNLKIIKHRQTQIQYILTTQIEGDLKCFFEEN